MSNETVSDADAPADEQTPDEQTPFEQENSEANSEAESLDAAPSAGKGEGEGEGEGEEEGDEKTLATPLAAEAPPLSPVERMEVRIDFEVGRVTLPVSSLANVAAGSVIEVPGVALDRVTAKSGGQAFAFGEFVELGGRVGFRILRLAETKEKS